MELNLLYSDEIQIAVNMIDTKLKECKHIDELFNMRLLSICAPNECLNDFQKQLLRNICNIKNKTIILHNKVEKSLYLNKIKCKLEYLSNIFKIAINVTNVYPCTKPFPKASCVWISSPYRVFNFIVDNDLCENILMQGLYHEFIHIWLIENFGITNETITMEVEYNLRELFFNNVCLEYSNRLINDEVNKIIEKYVEGG